MVITGGNAGIGYETAKDLSKRGAHIIILARNLERAKQAADDINNETGFPVDVIKLDLSALQSVRECAAELMERVEQVDILINNAGMQYYACH